MISLLRKVGGNSAFGNTPDYTLRGIDKSRYHIVLEKILQIANWRLEDAAVSTTELTGLIDKSSTIGNFLDNLRDLISARFDPDILGVEFPSVVFSISSSAPKFREVARSLRRADSYYLESSRLLMYTRRSNVAEWWQARNTSTKSALPHVIALFNAQLTCISASTVVHSVLMSNNAELNGFVSGVRKDRGNAQRVMKYSELFKFLDGQSLDNREYGSNVKDDTTKSFEIIQSNSATHHRQINTTILDLAQKSGISLQDLKMEANIVPGLFSDATYTSTTDQKIALEFHHKSINESNQNKIAIYILNKLKEYAINYGLTSP